MTTTNKYLREFDQYQLLCAQALAKENNSQMGDAVLMALETPVNGESLAMPIVCTGWETRASSLRLPKTGEKREKDREAYMQGALAAMVGLGVMTVERANMIAFLTSVGRLDQYMSQQAEKDC